MPWPTWNQAAIAAAVSVILGVIFRRKPSWPLRAAIVDATYEFSLIAGLYSLWRLARELPLAQVDGALTRGYDIVRIQEWTRLPTELSLQRFVLEYDWLARATNAYYAIVHVPALFAFLIWLFWRHRDQFPRWRNGLVGLTGFCLVIRFLRVAPPRFYPELGYIDLATNYGLSVYGPVGTGVSDQFAAMPSIHVGWAALVSFGVFASTTSRWRWFFMGHVVITMLVVSATGNHWWLDGIVAIALLGVALRIDTVGRAWLEARQTSSVGRPDRITVDA